MADHRVNGDPIIGRHCLLRCVLRGLDIGAGRNDARGARRYQVACVCMLVSFSVRSESK